MLFDRIKLSNEDFEGAPVDTTEAIIAGDLAYADAMDIAREAMMDATAMDAAQSAINALDAKLANEEYLLANPEKITTETVVLAHESYRGVAAILGANIEDIEGVVSHESIESSPITALQVSHEGVKDFIVKLYESIKLLFKKIANAIKKVVVKLIVALNGVEKAADKLLKSLKGASDTPKKSNLEDKEVKVWNKQFALFIALNSSIKSDEFVAGVVEIYNKLDNTLVKNIDILEDTAEDILNNLNKEKTDTEDTMYRTKSKTKLAELKNKLNEIAGKIKNFNDLKKALNVEDAIFVLPLTCTGTSIKTIVVEKNDDEKVTQNNIYSVKSLKVTVENELETISVISKENLIKNIGSLKSFAKGLKGFSDRRIKEIDAMYKELDKLADQKSSNVVSKFLLKQKASFGTSIRALVAGAYLDSVLGYSSASKKLLAYLRDHASMYKTTEL